MKTGLSRLGLLFGAGFVFAQLVDRPWGGVQWSVVPWLLVFSCGLGWLVGWLAGWALDGLAKSKKTG